MFGKLWETIKDWFVRGNEFDWQGREVPDQLGIRLFSLPKNKDIRKLILPQKLTYNSPENIALWINKNISYKHKISDNWQDSDETMNLKSGDCKAMAILFCGMCCWGKTRVCIGLYRGLPHAWNLFYGEGKIYLYDCGKYITGDNVKYTVEYEPHWSFDRSAIYRH